MSAHKSVVAWVAGVLVAAITAGIGAAQQARLPPPLQITPDALRQPQAGRAPASQSQRSGQASRSQAPPDAEGGNRPVFGTEPRIAILPGQAVPQNAFAGARPRPPRIMPYSTRMHRRVSGDALARSVFVANVLTGSGTGHFIRLPGGSLYALPGSAEKLKRMAIRQEVRKLALAIRKRDRVRLYKALRQARLQRPRRLREFFSDNSLQRGDVVVTTQGLKVFKGSSEYPYTASHFMPLSQWRKSAARQHRPLRLDAIERELRRTPQ